MERLVLVFVVIAELFLGGCATLLQNPLLPYYDEAPLVDNPVKSGVIPKDVNAAVGDKGRSSVTLKSLDRASGKLCFLVSTPNQNAPAKIALRGYQGPQDLEQKESYGKGGEFPTKVTTVSTGNQAETYESTEVVQYKDSMGRTVGKSERPTTKVMQYKVFVMDVCYPGKVLTAKTKYLGLEYTEEGLLGAQTIVTAAWRFND